MGSFGGYYISLSHSSYDIDILQKGEGI